MTLPEYLSSSLLLLFGSFLSMSVFEGNELLFEDSVVVPWRGGLTELEGDVDFVERLVAES